MAISKVVKNLARTQEILSVFLKHGFGDLLQRMGLEKYLISLKAIRRPPVEPDLELQTTPRRFRAVLEELGGAFVKLGQVLSLRPDILPADWIEALVPLQDEVATVEFDLIRATLAEDLGYLEDIFQYLDPEALAAGSIAQVHAGTTSQGTQVVVKVRKPGVKRKILQDCDVLAALAEILERHVPESRIFRPMQLVDEFRRAVNRELDFTAEGQNLDRFRANFQEYPRVIFPEPDWERTTERVLTMERVEGTKISLVERLHAQGTDTRSVAEVLAQALLRQVLEHGFVHGDPHPGNILVVDGDKVCFLDCGMVARLDERLQEDLLLLVSGGLRKDMDMVADVLLNMNALPPDMDRTAFLREGGLFLDRYHSLPLKRVSLRTLMRDLTEMIHKFRIQVPSELLLVAKALVSLEELGTRLSPDFDAAATAQPIVWEMVLKSYSPGRLGKKIFMQSRDLLRLVRDVPSDLRMFARILRDNELRITVEHRGVTEGFRHVDTAAKRLSMSIVIGSLIVGSSLVILAGQEPMYRGVPLLGIAGLLISAAMGMWLIMTMLRKD